MYQLGNRSSKSTRYIWYALPSWDRLDRQTVLRARARTLANTGNKIAARIARIEITTSSSTRLNPRRHGCRPEGLTRVSFLVGRRTVRHRNRIPRPLYKCKSVVKGNPNSRRSERRVEGA